MTRTVLLTTLLCVLVFVFVGSQIFAATHNNALAVGVGLGCAVAVAVVGRWWAMRPARRRAAARRADVAVLSAPADSGEGPFPGVSPARRPLAPSTTHLAGSIDRVQAIPGNVESPVNARALITSAGPAAAGFIVDRAASRARFGQLQTYLAEHVLTSRGEFICSSARSCKASLQRAGSAFLEAQGHAMGPCYDLRTADGVPFRVLVVPMESGGTNPAYQHISVEQRTSHLLARGAQPFRDRNPHMKGVTFALRLAFGLPVDDPNAEHLQFSDGSAAQLFSCFAMTNLLLCSAVAAGTQSSRSTSVMRANCARHLVETIKILQPTLVISQGAGLDPTLRASLGITHTVNQHLADCDLQGNRFTWVSLHHPTRNWSALSHPYLHEVVIPTINQARTRALSRPEAAAPLRPVRPAEVNPDDVGKSEMTGTRGFKAAGTTGSAVSRQNESQHATRRDAAHVQPQSELAGGDDLRDRRLTALLRQAIGIEPVRPLDRPDIGAWVMLDTAIGTKSTQRICVQQHGDKLILRTWMGELKPQAEALYRSGRAQRLMQFVSERHPIWYARPNVHLSFRSAAAALRLYPHCHLEATEYVKRWCGDDWAWVGAHPREEFRSRLWPWLQNRQYAALEDDEHVDAFLERLGRRDIFLRPSLEVTRSWPWAEAVELDERGALIGDVRSAVAELLSALSEPLPPRCMVTPENS